MSGTEIAYGATRTQRRMPPICLRACGTAIACRTGCLRACYAMSGTDPVYGSSSSARATQCPVLTWRMSVVPGQASIGGRQYQVEGLLRGQRSGIVLHTCYALSGTDIAYGDAAIQYRPTPLLCSI
eukprot:3940311-Rhodomonas_salina.5